MRLRAQLIPTGRPIATGALETLRHVLDLVDMVLIMSVNPGFGGQTFIPQMLEKIAELRLEAEPRGLELDGGIKTGNVDEVVRAGANIVVSGSGIFSESNYRTSILEMRERADLALGMPGRPH